MNGAPREVYASRDFVIVSIESVRRLDGEWSTAACFQRIAWRCERDGVWRAKMSDIADEIGVSERTAKRLTEKLRGKGWITGERENSWDPTLTWRVVWQDDDTVTDGADQAESDKLALTEASDETAGQPREGQVGTHESDKGGTHESATLSPRQRDNVALTSPKTDETLETEKHVDDAAASPVSPEPQKDLNEGRDDVARLCEHLADRLRERDVKVAPDSKRWRDAARLTMDNDGHTEAQVHNMIEWCQKDSFWSSTIHSMPNLREHYDRMRDQAMRSVQGGNVHPINSGRHNGGDAERERLVNALNG